jgi:predicted GTPase
MPQEYKLIDTAGIRRRAAVAAAGSTTEPLSVKRAFRAIHRSDVVALVIEALACITEQVGILKPGAHYTFRGGGTHHRTVIFQLYFLE